MTDYTSVANLALQKMGAADRIVARDQDSHAARTLAEAWDDVRKAAIRGGKKAPRWNCFERYAETPARAITPLKPLPYGWSAAYPMPDGALRLAEIVYPAGAAEGRWKFADNEVLLKDGGPLKAWWLFDNDEPATWDSLFVETFAALLAYQCADSITGDRGRKQDCWAEYQANLAAAAKVDATENPPVEPVEDDWIMARYR